MSELIETIGTEHVTTSAIISKAMGLEHRLITKLVNKYKSEFNCLGCIRSKSIKGETTSGGRPWKIYYLNESHVMFLFSLMENNKKNIVAAIRFIGSFKATKECLSSFIEALRTFDFGGFGVRYVYAAIDNSGRVKIGISNDPDRRLKELNIGNADTLKLVFVKKANGPRYADETAIHESVKEYNIRSEWFAKEAANKLPMSEIHGKTLIPAFEQKQISEDKMVD